MKAAIYARVSTDEQATKGNSIPEQIDRGQAYCKAMGYVDVDVYIDDGYSAKDMNRPDLKRMLDNSNKYKLIVTTKVDRLCRNLLDLLTIVDDFDSNQVAYASVSESFDTSTPAGRMVLQILGAFAEFERERIRERVKDNMKSIARKTNKVLARPCFGYDIIDGQYVINQEEAEHLRNMAQWAIEGWGALKIAKALKGVTTKEGKPFSEGSVRKLLHRETIAGMFVYNRTYNHKGKILTRPKEEWIINENHHEPIIDKETFEQLQLALNSRGIAKKQADNERWLLSGMVTCEHCGSKMVGQHRKKGKREYFQYLCSNYHKKGGCFRHYINRNDIEELTIKKVLSFEVNTGSKEFVSLDASRVEDVDLNELQEKLKKINKKMQRQIELYEDEEISREDFREAKARIEKDRASLLEEIEKAKEGSNVQLQKKLKSRIDNLKDDLLSDDRSKAKNAIRQLVHQVKVTNGDSFNVVYKL
ncbi:recombinase family protein [Paenibacillus alkalitolerans]|uniref:recombinase family protein n=1 Tax=Paenibacillus alkalitolerans TaxID=2799335 RepID=UPI0018F69387|nr:recombinase family protein [Paenibacillus alkalitolerans]